MPGNTLKWTTRTVAVLVLSAYLAVAAQQGMTKTSPEELDGGSAESGPAGAVPFLLSRGVPVVQVLLNGRGPYRFLVDTGTNVTLVEQPVLDQLSVSMRAAVPLHTTTADGVTPQAILEAVGIGGLKLRNLRVAALKQGQLAIYGDQVQGVLGEGFLKHFDLLLDYQRGVLMLDAGPTLADSLMGEHVAFRRSGMSPGGVVPDRILVQSKLPAFAGDPLACLVDSGTRVAVIFLRNRLMWRIQAARAGTQPQINLSSPFGGSSDCLIEPSRLEVGSERVRKIDVIACEEDKQADADSDCLLPTNLFRAVFISHRGGYIVLNPQFLEQARLNR